MIFGHSTPWIQAEFLASCLTKGYPAEEAFEGGEKEEFLLKLNIFYVKEGVCGWGKRKCSTESDADEVHKNTD